MTLHVIAAIIAHKQALGYFGYYCERPVFYYLYNASKSINVFPVEYASCTVYTGMGLY